MPKYYILTLGAKAQGVSVLGLTSLESPFDADVKLYVTKCYKAQFLHYSQFTGCFRAQKLTIL